MHTRARDKPARSRTARPSQTATQTAQFQTHQPAAGPPRALRIRARRTLRVKCSASELRRRNPRKSASYSGPKRKVREAPIPPSYCALREVGRERDHAVSSGPMMNLIAVIVGRWGAMSVKSCLSSRWASRWTASSPTARASSGGRPRARSSFRFHTAQVRERGGCLLGRRLYETMLVWETVPVVAGRRARARVSLAAPGAGRR